MAAPYKQFVTVEYPTHEGIVSARAESRARKACFQEMCEKWTEDMLPGHFEPGNEGKYEIAERDAQYITKKTTLAYRSEQADPQANVRKQIRPVLYGGLVPLVFHGDMAQDVQENIRIRAYPTRGTIDLGSGKLPYLGARRGNATVIGMAKEIRQVTREENYALTSVGARVYFARIQEAEGKYIYRTEG